MPELPEVETARRSLDVHVKGKQILDIEILKHEIVKYGDLTNIKGKVISDIERHGKYLIITFQNSNDVLFVHFGMSGVFIWAESSSKETSHACVVFKFSDGELTYQDVRRLQGMWLTSLEKPPWKSLGKDALDSKFTSKLFHNLLSQSRREIKVILLDQSIIAGVGNIYASEALHVAGINPKRLGITLSLKESTKLLKECRNILIKAIEFNGTTLRNYKLSNGKDGEFKSFLKVYDRKNEKCSKCGSNIEKITQAQRSTYYCSNPNCQK